MGPEPTSKLTAFILTSLFFGLSTPALAQDGVDASGDEALLDMSLEDLLDMPVTVASGSVEKKASESPGIVTVITARDIERIGARDLIDVLLTVPGLEPEYDMSGMIGLGIRGNWASEGKVLILIDGIEVNDAFFGSFSYGHHLPLSIIDRIEIIRGPGSVMYGGAAELGVIAIHTHRPSQKHEVMLNSGVGMMFDDQDATLGRAGGTVFYGGKHDRISFDISASGQDGHTSNRISHTPAGETFNMASDNISNVFINGNANLYGLELQLMFDEYKVDSTYPYAAPEESISDYTLSNTGILAAAAYPIQATDSFRLTPRLQYKRQEPWNHPDIQTDEGTDYPDWSTERRSDSIKANLDMSWDIVPQFNLSSGVVYDYNKGIEAYYGVPLSEGEKESQQEVAVWLQGLGTSKVVDYAAGIRFSYNPNYGPSFVPRAALTRNFLTYFHAKLLGAMAYKAPTLSNVMSNPDISPEKTGTLEVELGARARDVFFITGNFFWNQIRDVIVYTYQDNFEGYDNQGTVSSLGAEADARLRISIIELKANYSFAHMLDNKVPDYTVPDDDGMALGMATHKVTSSLSVNPFGKFFITPAVVYLSPRWAVESFNDDWTANYGKIDSEVQLDLTLLHKDLFTEGFDLSLSAHNLLNEHQYYANAYVNYDDSPLPGPGREIMLQLTWRNF